MHVIAVTAYTDHMLCFSLALFAGLDLDYANGIYRFPDGSTLITEGASIKEQKASAVYLVDSLGVLLWAYLNGDLIWAHSANPTSGGDIIISDTENDRAIIVNKRGEIVWEYSDGLNYVNDAKEIAPGRVLISDRDNSRVIEVDTASRSIVWSYTALDHQHNPDRLPNGNTIIANSGVNRIVEVDSLGNIVWTYSGTLNWPRDADRLSNGNTLITDTRGWRIIIVNPAGQIVWQQSVGFFNLIYDSDMLANGHILYSSTNSIQPSVIEIDTATRDTLWQYPETRKVLVDTFWVMNPSSGCSLFVQTFRPEDASASRPYPPVIIIPGGNGYGSAGGFSILAHKTAQEGFIATLFDPDGRGQSTNGGSYTTEDYNGFIHQDGLRQVMLLAASLPYSDPSNLGLWSQSYGVTMAAGALARYPGDPFCKFLLDWEGPADRSQTCADSGGHVPVPADSEAFWQEREAARFMKNLEVFYLRFQTQVDHNTSITDNIHAIALVDSATSTAYGGAGRCPWTRVNDSTMNQPNTVYTVDSPPVWVSEQADFQNLVTARDFLYLHELVAMDYLPAREHTDFYRTPALSAWPNPFIRSVRFSLQPGTRGETILIYRSDGSLVRRIDNPGQETFWDGTDRAGKPVPPGVYIARWGRETVKMVRVVE